MNLSSGIPIFFIDLITLSNFQSPLILFQFSTLTFNINVFSEAHKHNAQLFKLQNNTNAHLNDKIDLNGSKKLFPPIIPPMFKIQFFFEHSLNCKLIFRIPLTARLSRQTKFRKLT